MWSIADILVSTIHKIPPTFSREDSSLFFDKT